jgi:DNA-binding XRE family transcriptional regulator
MNLALKTRILASGKSQIMLAREIGISEPQLSKVVGGWVRPDPKVKTKIAEVLGCGVEDICFDSSSPSTGGPSVGAQ